MAELEIGIVTHYFGHLGVAAIQITGNVLKVGDTIHIKGHTTDFTTTVQTMQVEHQAVQEAKKGDAIGIKVPGHAREHDKVFVVTP